MLVKIISLIIQQKSFWWHFVASKTFPAYLGMHKRSTCIINLQTQFHFIRGLAAQVSNSTLSYVSTKAIYQRVLQTGLVQGRFIGQGVYS